MALILRSVKGSELTFTEMDDNLTYLFNQTITQQNIISSVTLGAINAGDTITSGSNLQSFITQLLSKTFNPTTSAAYATLASNAASLEIIGKVFNLTLTETFNRGSINGVTVSGIWNSGGSQGPLVGAAQTYTINGTGPQFSNNVTVNNYTVVQGASGNTFSASVAYAAGQQPIDSTGANYGSPASAGTATCTLSFEGVYPIYAPTDITLQPSGAGALVSSAQTLYSMLNSSIIGNDKSIKLVAEPNISGGGKQYIDIPSSWPKTLTAINYFNSVSNQWDSTNQLTAGAMQFSSTVQHTIAGQSVNYKRYINTGPNHGANTIQLIFT